MNTYVSLPIFRGLDALGCKNYEQAHTRTRDNHSNDNNNYYKLFKALKLIRIIYTVLMQNRSCFTRKQTCNGKYTKHCTRTRHQLKMAVLAEVSKRRSNFRIRQFKEKRHYNIAANLTFNMTVSFVTLLIARTARITCADRHTHTHTHKTTTVTLSAHVRRGLTSGVGKINNYCEDIYPLTTPIHCNHTHRFHPLATPTSY